MPRTVLVTLMLVLAGCSRPDGRETVIVNAAWVREHPAAIRVEAFWDEDKDQGAAHLPAAVAAGTDAFENGGPRWHLRPFPEVAAAIGRLGIRAEDTVVVYGRSSIAAARVWWILWYAGVRDVRFLNGGLAAWQREGGVLAGEFRRPAPVGFAGIPRGEALATEDAIRLALRHGSVLADVRSPDEWHGRSSGYSYLRFAGRIPRAVHLGDADDRAGLYQNPDGSLKPLAEIEARWRQAGVRRDDGREIIFYCGSGWRSSLAYLCAHALGFKRIRNYSDGWSGWGIRYERTPTGWSQRRSGNPIEP